METLISFTRDPAFDIQLDTHLEAGEVIYSGGPDRAYLFMPYSQVRATAHPQRLEGDELLALWLIDSAEAGQWLSAALGVALPQTTQTRPFQITWIKDGQIAVKRQPIGADAALWLLHRLAAKNQLDYAAQLFGGEAVDES